MYITAIEPLLNTLDVEGKILTIDAMGCQKEIARIITRKKADYVLAVKGNQETLRQEIQICFLNYPYSRHCHYVEKNHGRIEKRTCSVIHDLRFVDEAVHWAALCCIVRIISQRTIGDKTTTATRCFINSTQQSASYFLQLIRSHWGIENRLHWVLDMVFGEDYCRKRQENAAENFNLIRKMALNFIRSYKDEKRSLRRRRLAAGWNTEYLQKIMQT